MLLPSFIVLLLFHRSSAVLNWHEPLDSTSTTAQVSPAPLVRLSPSPTVGPTAPPTLDNPASSLTDTPTSYLIDAPASSLTDNPASSLTDTPTSSLTDSPESSLTDTPKSSLTDTPTSSPTDTPKSSLTAPPTSYPTPPSTNSHTDPLSSLTDSSTSSPKDHQITSPKVPPAASLSVEPMTSLKLTPNPTHQPTQTPKTPMPTAPKPSDWFNYDPNSSFGPGNWGGIRGDDYVYLKDQDRDCNGREQSPVNIVHEDKCEDDHALAHHRGSTDFDELDFVIRPSSLRVYLGDRKKAGGADFSNLNPDPIPAVFVDVKIKSEHHWFGKQYPGEFQIFHYWKDKDKYVVISMMMDDSSDKINLPLEQFIREWEEVAWKRQNECNRRKDPNIPMYYRKYSRASYEEKSKIWRIDAKPGGRADYDIYRFQTTGWYCAYEGSLTEPPCSEEVHWRILDVPMRMSKDQYRRMQTLLSERLNDNCERETAAYNGGVNRPLQSNRNDIWCCSSRYWKFKKNKDSMYWLESWDEDYHGWKGIENYKLLNFTNP